MTTKPTLDHVIARWTRIGVLFGGSADATTPDLERLLLDTARSAPGHARLFTSAVSWLARYDVFVARHRLKRLVRDELEPESGPVLGLILDLAIRHGASPTLNIAGNLCGRADPPRPLFDVHASSDVRRRLAERTACDAARARGLWAPDVSIKDDALRPGWWIVQRNPSYAERAIRKGDLRCTVLEALRRDAPGQAVASEQALMGLCAANRPAVAAALDDLEREGLRLRQIDPTDRRRHRIVLNGDTA